MQIHIHALARVDERGHPAAPHLLREAVFTDVQVGVVDPVHDEIAGMSQVETAGSHEVDRLDFRHRVDADDPLFCRHGVYYHAVEPVLEGVIHAGAAVEVHV